VAKSQLLTEGEQQSTVFCSMPSASDGSLYRNQGLRVRLTLGGEAVLCVIFDDRIKTEFSNSFLVKNLKRQAGRIKYATSNT
jgi:hypothetical protein